VLRGGLGVRSLRYFIRTTCSKISSASYPNSAVAPSIHDMPPSFSPARRAPNWCLAPSTQNLPYGRLICAEGRARTADPSLFQAKLDYIIIPPHAWGGRWALPPNTINSFRSTPFRDSLYTCRALFYILK